MTSPDVALVARVPLVAVARRRLTVPLVVVPIAAMAAGSVVLADPATLEPMSWALVGIRVVLPLGFLAALFQAELFAGAARGRLLEQLLGRPSPQEWRTAIATALDDPPLSIAFWDPAAERYRGTDGAELAVPDPGSGRSIVEAGRHDHPVAAMVMDDGLAEDPELVRAASSATVLAVENGNLEGQLHASQLLIHEVPSPSLSCTARFRVDDDGVGFDPEGVPRGRGLDNIADRVHGAGGSVTFQSTSGQGTRVVGSIPVASPPRGHGN